MIAEMTEGMTEEMTEEMIAEIVAGMIEETIAEADEVMIITDIPVAIGAEAIAVIATVISVFT